MAKRRAFLEPEAGLKPPVTVWGGFRLPLVATRGAFSLAGQQVTFRHNRVLAAGQGVFTLAGQDAVLTGPDLIRLTAEQGAFLLTGVAANFLHNRVLVAGQGLFTLAGQNATLIAPSAFAETFSLNADNTTSAATHTASNVEIPSGSNRMLLDMCVNGADSDELDPGNINVPLLQEGGTQVVEIYRLLEASMPAAGSGYSLTIDMTSASIDVFRQVIALKGANQTTHQGANQADNASQVTLDITRSSGSFPIGSIFYLLGSDGSGSRTFTMSGDASIVRQSGTGWDGTNTYAFCKGVLASAKATVSATLTTLSGGNPTSTARLALIGVVVEPA